MKTVIYFFFFRKNHTENEMNLLLKFNPICVLQEMCMDRNWNLPKYEIFELEGSNGVSVECTVLTSRIKGKQLNSNF